MAIYIRQQCCVPEFISSFIKDIGLKPFVLPEGLTMPPPLPQPLPPPLPPPWPPPLPPPLPPSKKGISMRPTATCVT